MRYVAIAFVLLSYPALVHLLKTNPRLRYWAYFALGVLPFTVANWNLDAALINWAAWPGYAKGIIVTLEDTLALAIIANHRSPRGTPPLAGFIIAYILAAAFSIALADTPTATVFYVFQLLRMLVLFIAVAKIASDPKGLQWLVMGLSVAMGYEAFVTIYQRLTGAFQAPGTMSHPNQLGIMAHMVVLPALGMVLGGNRNVLIMLSIPLTMLVIALGASRATIGFDALGILLVLAFSMRRHATRQKKQMIGLSLATLVVATPFLLHSVGQRMAQQLEHQSNYDERAAFELAAKMIWADNPMGVGANEYVLVANAQGYSARAGVTWSGGSRATNVHNLYLLIAAETGWAGLITYVLMIGAFVVGGWRFAFAQRRDPRGDLALGCVVGLVIVAMHNKYEWIGISYQVQYLFAISAGIVSGLVRVRNLERRAARRAASQLQQEPAGGAAIA